MTKQLLIFLFSLSSTIVFGQTKINETENYTYISSTEIVMHGVKTDLKLNAKTNHFSAITNVTGDMFRNNKEKLKGNYVLRGDTIIFSFKYSQYVLSPMFTCKELQEGAAPSLCVDTLIYKTDFIATKDTAIILKKIK